MTQLAEQLDRFLGTHGEDFEVIRVGGNVAVKGRSWTPRRISQHWGAEYLKEAIFSSGEVVSGGEIIHDKTNDIYYFIYQSQKAMVGKLTLARNIVLLKITEACEIKRPQDVAGEHGGSTKTFTSIATDIRCHLKVVSADLRGERPGLSEAAASLLYIQKTVDAQVLDRIVIGDRNFQVETLNKDEFAGLYELELNKDER